MLSLSARWQRSAAQRKGRGSTVGTDAQRDFATSAVQRTCKRPHALHVGDLATLVIEERIVADLGEVRGQGQHDILILGAEPVDQAQVNHRTTSTLKVGGVSYVIARATACSSRPYLAVRARGDRLST